MLLRLILTTLSLVALAPRIAAPQSYEGWREYPRETEVFKEAEKAKHSIVTNSKATMKDIFILKETVHITEPIRSNGGDVIIVANDLHIDAPIDTRVYFKYKYLYWQPHVRKSRTYGIITYYEKPIVRSFNYYYNWREYYDNDSKVYSFKGFEGPEDLDAAKDYLDRAFEAPQLPSAPMLSVSNDVRRQDGGDAPDQSVVWPNVRSGSIRIFASRIHFCEACKKAMDDSYPPIEGGDVYDQTRAVFLQAGGLKGGRGGAGMTTACSYHRSAQTDACDVDRPKLGALSGKPGRGGDAGDVIVKFVGRKPSDQEKADLYLASNVSGGRPSHVALKRTPKFDTLYKRPSRAIFTDEVPVSHERLNGNGGLVDISAIKTDEAISEIYALLAQYETNGNYAIDPLLQIAADDPTIFSFSPSDLLPIFLEEEMTRLQRDFILALPDALNGKNPSRSVRDFFSTIDCKSQSPIYTDLINSLLHEICGFERIGSIDFVRSYLYHIGGIYREGDIDVNLGIRQSDIVTKLIDIGASIRKTLDEQKDTHIMLYDTIKDKQRHDIEAAITAVNEQRRRLLQAVEDKKKSRKGFDKLLEPIVKVGDGIVKVYTSVMSGSWLTAGKEIYGVAKNVSDIRLTDYGLAPADVTDIDEQLSILKVAFRKFLETTSRARAEMLASANVNLHEIVDARGELKARQLKSKLRFRDYVRASIQEFVRTNFEANRVLKGNMALIDQSLDGSLRVPTDLDVTAPKQSCGPNETGVRVQDAQGPLGCIRISSVVSTSALVVSSNWMRNFPLFVVEPGKNTFRIDLEFAFDRKDVTFGEIDLPR